MIFSSAQRIETRIRQELLIQEMRPYTNFTGIIHIRTGHMNQPAHACILLCRSRKGSSKQKSPKKQPPKNSYSPFFLSHSPPPPSLTLKSGDIRLAHHCRQLRSKWPSLSFSSGSVVYIFISYTRAMMSYVRRKLEAGRTCTFLAFRL